MWQNQSRHGRLILKMTCTILHLRNDSPKAQTACTARAATSPVFQLINGLVMEYKFPTECCNLPTNLVLSAIYWQVVGAAERSVLLKALGAVSDTEGKGQEALDRTVPSAAGTRGSCEGSERALLAWQGQKKPLGNHTLGNITTGVSYFKDVSALKMPNPSPHFEVFLRDIFAHTHMPPISQATHSFMVYFRIQCSGSKSHTGCSYAKGRAATKSRVRMKFLHF